MGSSFLEFRATSTLKGIKPELYGRVISLGCSKALPHFDFIPFKVAV
jgi:hypothetical protein